jgi:hypothetical protein
MHQYYVVRLANERVEVGDPLRYLRGRMPAAFGRVRQLSGAGSRTKAYTRSVRYRLVRE